MLLLPAVEAADLADAHALLDAAAGGHVEEAPADPLEAPVDARPRGRFFRAEALGRLELDREADRGRDGDRLGVRLRRHVRNAGTTRSRRQDEDRPSEGRASEALRAGARGALRRISAFHAGGNARARPEAWLTASRTEPFAKRS